MSDITPPSYIDDGVSFQRRLPPRSSLANISQWLSSTTCDAASAYTGSYIDDGADLLLPTAPGFGLVDTRFYKHKKRRDDKTGPWNEVIARAVGGDMQRSLAKMRGVANVEVKRPERRELEDRKRKAERRGVVSVPAPLKWGTFIIKGDDGRVVVVDENGEFDSGAVKVSNEQTVDSVGKSKRWVKAVSSVDIPLSIAHNTDTKTELAQKSKSGSRRMARSKPHLDHVRNSASKPLTPIPESTSAYEDDDPIEIRPLASPTDFFMTGGLSGWPSREASPGPASPIVPHAITWDTTSPPLASSVPSKPTSTSPVYSAQGRWPSPPLSPSASSSGFTNLKDDKSWVRSSSGRISSEKNLKGRSSSSRLKEKGKDDVSTETYSSYKAPAIVEVTYDETPPGEVSYSQAGWGGEAASARNWSNSNKDSSIASVHTHSSVRELGWGGPAAASNWGGSQVDRTQSRDKDDGRVKHGDQEVDDEWDGFERPKTTSEVSVAGSGSEQSWPASQHSHRSHRTGCPPRHSQSVYKSQNGYDEDNATYLNATWGGVPVRVASRRTSVAGWD